MPAFGNLAGRGDLKRMNSVMPPISSVAWSSFLTGKNPASHNILGFIDRNPANAEMFFPNSKNMMSKTLLEILSEHGKKVISINVPLTYPPRAVNGLLVGGFLSYELKKAVYPPEKAEFFEKNGYIIDADTDMAHNDPDRFLGELFRILEKRFEILFLLLKKQAWDFFIFHVMETDRLYHFFWDRHEKNYPEKFLEFHKCIDFYIGRLVEKLPDDTDLIMMSDHGFCSLKKEVNINHLLMEKGYLRFQDGQMRGLGNIDRSATAYSLIPGRIFVNLEGREKNGSVKPGQEYNGLLNELKRDFEELTDPETGEKIIDRVFLRDEVYIGKFLGLAADMFLLPVNGYDLKAPFVPEPLLTKKNIFVMHTFDDAFLYIRNGTIEDREFSIIDVAPSILNIFNIESEGEMEGKPLFHTAK